MKAKPVYYTAFGLKNGTVYAAMPVRKPRKTKHGPTPRASAGSTSGRTKSQPKCPSGDG